VRTVATSSGAQAVQIVYSSRRGSRSIEHIGSAHDEVELELLKTVARQRISAGQGTLDLDLDSEEPVRGGPLPITSSQMGHLVDALRHSYRVLALEEAAGGDKVFEQLVLAWIIEPTSKFDSVRVLAEAGLSRVSCATVKRRLPVFATEPWREEAGSRVCGPRRSRARVPGALRRVDPLLRDPRGRRVPRAGVLQGASSRATDHHRAAHRHAGFPLMLNAFEGNKAETTTMLPAIQAFQAAHHLQDVTVVADAGMVSMSNQKAIEAAGLSFILGARTPDVPYVVKQWRAAHPDQEIPDGHVFVQPWPASATDGRRDQVIYYRYRADSARRTLHGIDQQVAKAERAVDGKMPVKRNRFVQLSGGSRSVNRTLEAKARALAGIKGYADVGVMPRGGT